MNVVILHDTVTDDSRPDEVDALHQAEFVGESLRALGHRTSTASVSLDLEAMSTSLVQSRPDLAFNLVESLAGHGRLLHVIPAMLEALRIPFSGSGSSASLLTTNKPLAKTWLHQSRIPTPPWRCPDTPSPLDIRPPCTCIVKPAWEDASVGIEDGAVLQVSESMELDRTLRAASLRFGEVFAERFIEGREFNVSLLANGGGVEVLPMAEIEFVDYPPDKPRIVGYSAKWSESSFEYCATCRRFEFADSDDTLLDRLRSLAVACWNLFGLRGYARVDFRVDESGQPWVLEVNANPCLSLDAGFMAAAHRLGLAPETVIERIVASALPPNVREELASRA